MQTHFLTFAKGNAIRTVMFGAANFDAATRDVQAAREAHGITPISIAARHEHYGVRDFIRVLSWISVLSLIVLPSVLVNQGESASKPWEFAQIVGTIIAGVVLLAIMTFGWFNSRARIRAMERRTLDEALGAKPNRQWVLIVLYWAFLVVVYIPEIAKYVTSAVGLLRSADSDHARGLLVLMVTVFALSGLAFDRTKRVG